MGKLLQFARKNSLPSDPVDRDGDAELVLFTGVRYQRQSPDDESQPDDEPQRGNGS